MSNDNKKSPKSQGAAEVRKPEPPPLAYVSRILDALVHELHKQNVVGEYRNAKIAYLVLTSRLFERPVSAVVKGQSSAGKSFTLGKVVELFPDDAYVDLSSLSPKALAYSGKQDFKHKTMVVAEADGLGDKAGAAQLRTLISEGKVKHLTVGKENDKLEQVELEIEGPTNLLSTTTALMLDGELETRFLTLHADESPEQTKRVMKAVVAQQSGVHQQSSFREQWHQLQEWLATAEHRVVIPYGDRLAELVGAEKVRMRRDFNSILGLIRAHAILHQERRMQNDDGCIIAALEDYAIVRELIDDPLSQAYGLSVADTIRETVEAVRAATKSPVGITLTALADFMGCHKSSVSRRVAKAGRYLKGGPDPDHSQGKLIQLGEPLPGDEPLLPPVDKLVDASLALLPPLSEKRATVQRLALSS